MLFGVLETENAAHHIHFGIEVADTLMSLGHYDFALKYYLMLEGIPGSDKVINPCFPFSCSFLSFFFSCRYKIMSM